MWSKIAPKNKISLYFNRRSSVSWMGRSKLPYWTSERIMSVDTTGRCRSAANIDRPSSPSHTTFSIFQVILQMASHHFCEPWILGIQKQIGPPLWLEMIHISPNMGSGSGTTRGLPRTANWAQRIRVSVPRQPDEWGWDIRTMELKVNQFWTTGP